MQPDIGYHQPGDIGGPMKLGEGYRWNVPVVTYAFDQSFIDCFCTNAIGAVEQAVQRLNDLPGASRIVLTNFAVETSWENYRAMVGSTFHMESAALSILLRYLGLGQPLRDMYNIKWHDPMLVGATDYLNFPMFPDSVAMRNFDPQTLTASGYLNGLLYVWYIYFDNPADRTNSPMYLISWPADASLGLYDSPYMSVTHFGSNGNWPWSWNPGRFFIGLTRDDVGGLKYLYDRNLVQMERVLGDVHAAGTNGTNFVNFAPRPGIGKVTFVRQYFNATTNSFIPIKVRYTDRYFAAGSLQHQQLERVVTQPDILFLGARDQNSYTASVEGTDTSGWWNSATATGSQSDGPGLICPPIRITFKQPTPYVQTSATEQPWSAQDTWGSFDGSTNAPIAFRGTQAGPLEASFQLFDKYGTNGRQLTSYTWRVPIALGQRVGFQISTNLADWTTVANLTNVGIPARWQHFGSQLPRQFFRVVQY
jgi:hypothetical protein